MFSAAAGCIVAWIVMYYIYQKMYQPVFRRLLQDMEEIREFE